MSRRRETREEVESGQPLLGGEDNENIIIGETLGKRDSEVHSFSLDVEDPCARSSPVAQAGDIYHDRGWALAFKTNVIVTIIAAVCFGSLALEAILADQEHGGWGTRRLSDSRHEFGWLSALFVGLALTALVVGCAKCVLHSFICCGKPLVWSSVALTFVLWLWMIFVLFLDGKHTWALLASVTFPTIARVVCRERARLTFGAVTLQVAAMAVKSMPGTIFASLYMIGVQLLWVLVSLVAAVGSFAYLETVEGSDGSMHRAIYCAALKDLPSNMTPGCYCMGGMVSEGACQYRGWGIPLMLLWVVSMLWGCFVMKNVVTSTVSGSVAAWWYSPNDVKPAKAALYRATRYSFGTLCKAALFVNFPSVLFFIIEVIMQVVPGASVLLRAALTGVMYPLNYTVTFVGIYGLDLTSAFRRVREVFIRRGATSLANDLIAFLATWLLMICSAFAYGVVLGLTQVGILTSHKPSFQVMVPVVFGNIAFAFVIATVVEVVRSAVKAVLVCFIQDPEILKNTRGDELHNKLTAAWVKIHAAGTPRSATANPIEPPNADHDQTQ